MNNQQNIPVPPPIHNGMDRARVIPPIPEAVPVRLPSVVSAGERTFAVDTVGCNNCIARDVAHRCTIWAPTNGCGACHRRGLACSWLNDDVFMATMFAKARALKERVVSLEDNNGLLEATNSDLHERVSQLEEGADATLTPYTINSAPSSPITGSQAFVPVSSPISLPQSFRAELERDYYEVFGTPP
ncbi:hypothetical protein PCANC_19721 [Puccinia coronata f. sp. avenae]|uniref:Zn(2)-C6 fungal-type domain-containing protein n=1 Tax=Puccinia coronata f. sp. avenae TaxID=200324 RepID=A0A2N5SBE1_9BASI|nr:hypothetical protein PCANC_19721 [Puccinia coronata f. sp. avenae]